VEQKMRLKIINGPNLNLLGKREPEIYGTRNFHDYCTSLQFKFKDLELGYFQSNLEGDIISQLHKCDEGDYDGIILNAAGYTHTSIAIGDAVAAIDTPVVEVHISNIASRESYRQHSYISPHAIGVIFGFGLEGYELALLHFKHHLT
jgi:3-dehydroquinate dehydratase-2